MAGVKIDLLPWELATAQRIARIAARRWSLDEDDVHGELWLWLVVNYNYVVRYRDEGTAGRAKFAASLHRRANVYARDERSARIITPKHLKDRDESHYTVEDVVVALASVLLVEDRGAYSEASWAASSDVGSSFSSLRRDEKELLVCRFVHGMTYEQIGGQLGVTREAARMRLNRTLEKLRLRASETRAQLLKRRDRKPRPDGD